MSGNVPKPLPVPDERSEAYWASAARGIFALPRCAACGRFSIPPEVVCPECGSTDPGFVAEPVAGGGTVRSWTVVRDAFLPGFAGDLPYVLVDVELDAQPGLRTIGRLVDGPDAPLRTGDRVTVTFDELAAGVMVPAFALLPS